MGWIGAALRAPIFMWASFLSVPAAVYVWNRSTRPTDDMIRAELRRRGHGNGTSVSSAPSLREDGLPEISAQNKAVMEQIFANRHAKFWKPEEPRRRSSDPTEPAVRP